MKRSDWLTLSSLGSAVCLTTVGHQEMQPRLIEPEDYGLSKPDGFQWYVVRSREFVFEGAAAGVTLGAPPFSLFDDLIFERDAAYEINRRYPRSIGEESHVLLPETFALPDEIARLRARPLPAELPRFVFKSEEIDPPRNAPTGYRAFRVLQSGMVVEGVAEQLIETEEAVTYVGSELRVRRSYGATEYSEIWVPPGTAIPAKMNPRSA